MERTRPDAAAEENAIDARTDAPGAAPVAERQEARAGATPASSAAGHSLSSEEMRQVLRRAADLELAANRAGEPALDLHEVERIGVEAGLSREAIQRAFVELRTGALQAPAEPTLLDKLVGPESVSAQTLSPLGADEARRRLHQILKDELLHPEERQGARTSWVPTPGLWATIQRGLNWQGQSAWHRGRLTTEVHAAPGGVEAKSIVKVEASPGGRSGGPLAAVMTAVPLLGVAAATFASSSPAHAQLGLMFGGMSVATSGFILAVSRFAYRKQLRDLRIAMARVLEKFSTDS